MPFYVLKCFVNLRKGKHKVIFLWIVYFLITLLYKYVTMFKLTMYIHLLKVINEKRTFMYNILFIVARVKSQYIFFGYINTRSVEFRSLFNVLPIYMCDINIHCTVCSIILVTYILSLTLPCYDISVPRDTITHYVYYYI